MSDNILDTCGNEVSVVNFIMRDGNVEMKWKR